MMNLYIALSTTGPTYGKNLATWGLEQIFWLVLIAGIAVAAGAFVKKSWAGGALSAIGTALVCYFIKNPTKLSEIGTKLAQIIGL